MSPETGPGRTREEIPDPRNQPEKDDLSRRDFLGKVAQAGGVAVVLLLTDELAGLLRAEEGPDNEAVPYDPKQHRYIYLIDIPKCIGCGACVRACSRENKVPEGFYRTWVERYRVCDCCGINVDSPDGGKNGFKPVPHKGKIRKGFFVPKLCGHCKNTPCTQVCPLGASYSTPDEVVLVDEKRCIGCGYCIQACPYSTRFIHPQTHVASKCTLCYHRITKGLRPACVQACPRGSRMFGDMKRDGDKVAELVRTRPVMVLKPELLTLPRCYYMGLSKEIV